MESSFADVWQVVKAEQAGQVDNVDSDKLLESGVKEKLAGPEITEEMFLKAEVLGVGELYPLKL